MTPTAEFAFWAAVSILAYGYAGYPLLLAVVGQVLDRRIRKGSVTPSVSLLIAAYNEEEAIADRLENALAGDYPRDLYEVIVVSDGSTDRTEEIVAAFDDERIRLLSRPRRGKAFALKDAVRHARGDILVFSDANTDFEPDGLRALVRSFADPEVGGVAGHTMYRTDDEAEAEESSGRGEALYWRYDSWLKRLETRTGSVVSAHGGMYAIRAELFRLEDPAVTDDFAVSTGVVEQGRRLVFEPAARAWERAVQTSGGEFRRRVRLMTRGLRAVVLRRRLLDPVRYGFYSVVLFSHKVLRRLLPLALPVLLVSSIALWRQSPVFAAAAAGQVVFYGLAAAGWALRTTSVGRWKLFYVPFFYCLANLASIVALANLLRGRRIERWSPQRNETEMAGSGGNRSFAAGPRPVGGILSDPGSANPAVVIGLDCHTGLQTARILAARGIPVVGIAGDTGHPCARTRVCEEIMQTDTSGPDLLDVLRELAPRLGRPAVLFPCTDMSVLRLARGRDALPPTLRIVLPEADVIETLLDKGRFQALARERGYPIPETRLIRIRDEAVEASRNMSFPCVVKPPVKTPRWESRTSAKVFKASTPGSLISLFDRFADAADGLVVQEWVEGVDTDHFTCNCYIDRHGEPLVSFTTRKLRQWPREGGQASLSEECRNDRVREETLRLFREVGHRGFGYLEMKWDARTGRHRILEANVGRPTGRSAAAEAAGVEFLATAYLDALDHEPPPNRLQRFGNTKWIHLRHDLQAALDLRRRGALSVSGWRHSVRGPRVYALLSWNDPAPFLADLGRSAEKLVFGSGGRTSAAAPRTRRIAPSTSADSVPARSASPPVRPAGSAPAPSIAPHASPPAAESVAVDFETGAGVQIRLVGPTPADVHTVEKVVGPAGELMHGDPDILIRYVDELPNDGLRLIQADRSCYTDDDFFVVGSGSGGARARLRVGDGEPWSELVCARGVDRVPLLQPLVDLMSLDKGWAPLHASGWVHRGIGAVAAGWDRSGKTGCLLAFGDRGAAFVGDDRVMVHRSGERMVGLHRPITIRDWHLAELPTLAWRRGLLRRSLIGLGPWLDGLQRGVRGGNRKSSTTVRVLGRILGRARRGLSADVSPEAVFGESRCPGRGVPGVVFLLVSHDADAIRLDPLDSGEAAGRLAAAVRADIQPLVEAHLAMRSAFPDRRWTLLERAHDLAAEILEEALSGKPAYVVRHPYPVRLPELYGAMDAVMRSRAPRAPRVIGGDAAGRISRPRRRAPVRRFPARGPGVEGSGSASGRPRESPP